jgi:ribose transport system substrate-binding protein
MAIGIVAALKEAGLAGKVKTVGTDGIPDAFDAIADGTMAATEFMDSRYQSQLGMTMALAAKAGKLDIASIPPEHRSFLISGTHVTAENVKTFVEETLNKMPEYDLSDFWSAWVGPAT